MWLAARSLRQATRTLPRSLPSRPPNLRPPRQTRFATYQHFPLPGRGGSGGPRYSNFRPVRNVQYVWYNYRILVLGGGGVFGTVYVLNLEEVPVSHRRRFNLISPEYEKRYLGDAGYQQILQEYRGKILPENHPYTKLVAQVTERLLPSTGGLAGDEWRVHVVDDPEEMNAFVLPGGKVFVFTGILPICEDENGLAAVLGHEIAHNVAHHVSERLSRSFFVLPAVLLVSLVFDVSGSLASSLVNLILSLPNSRAQEAEADHLGLLIMAESCYDPRTAVDFWGRMKAAEKISPPQFLSTHPSNYNRMEHIRTLLPDAEAKYQSSECGLTSGYVNDFKSAFGGKRQSERLAVGQPQQTTSKDDDNFF